MLLTIKGPRVLVERIDDQIPESTILEVVHLDERASNFAKVIAIGKINETIEVGDTVVTKKYSGAQIPLDGHTYYLLQEEDVLGIVT